MDTIEEYKIIESRDLNSLTEKVNAALKEGWQPHGAPAIHCVNFHQPTGGEKIGELRNV